MASINVRKETGKLYFDFKFRNQRCREQTTLKDTAVNRKKLEKVLERIQAEIMLGSFDYARTFPNSRLIKKFEEIERKTLIANGATEIPSFEKYANIWFEQTKVQWRDSYTDTVHYILFKRLIPQFGDVKISNIKKMDLLEFRAGLAKVTKKNGIGLSPSHINRHMKIMRMILIEASDNYEFTSPYRGIKPLKVPKSDIQPFTPEEINLILNNVRDDFVPYFTIRFFTGMRTGEIDGLKWKHIDLDNRRIQIRETIVKGEVSYTKNDFSQRDIQMSEPVYQAFIQMKSSTGDQEFVFVNKNGNPLEHNAVTKRVWYPLLDSLGIRRRNPYQMRHTAATLWLASGESPEWIANQMGHANTEMLFRVYSRYVPNLTRQDGSAADKMLSNVMEGTTNA
ncbi:DUF3596 domain-containing protein [Paraglaciecola sp.]|uniref:Arm DNA-binding domain-containing protein n=1 Tax=Paraglaciecola sp. TaxID=1920173 RepID=UPI0032661A25